MSADTKDPFPVFFITKDGKRKFSLPSNLTIEQLTMLGIRLELVPEEQPWQPNEIRNEV